MLSLAAAAVALVLLVAPIPKGYFERLETIQTYDEIGETSAISRLHFWRVALSMSADHPLGIGLWNFQSLYDSYDTLNGLYGRGRALHNSFLQALVEAGWLGGTLFAAMMAYAAFLSNRVRNRGSSPGLSPEDARFLTTGGTALLAAFTAFAVGGFFSSAAYIDLLWLLFGLAAALDRISLALCHGTAVRPEPVGPLANAGW